MNRIITDLGVFDVGDNELSLAELAPGTEIDEVKSKTEATLSIKFIGIILKFNQYFSNFSYSTQNLDRGCYMFNATKLSNSEISQHPEFDNHEQIVFGEDQEAGLVSIIAIHNTQLGPSLGGCRMWPYNSLDEALSDALRLSKGMTYKHAIAGLNFGGGKAGYHWKFTNR